MHISSCEADADDKDTLFHKNLFVNSILSDDFNDLYLPFQLLYSVRFYMTNMIVLLCNALLINLKSVYRDDDDDDDDDNND